MTTRIPPEIRAEILDAIREHIAENGNEDYDAVRKRWPEYLQGGEAERRRFFRLVREAKEFGKAPGELKAEAVTAARAAVKKNVPAAPMPATLYGLGGSARAKINMMSELDQLLVDGHLQRAMAVKVDDEGVEKIKNTHLFNQSMQRRLDYIQSYLALFREVYDLQQMQTFYEEICSIIVEEIHPLDPVVSGRIIQRLKALNDAQGMTMHAQPS